MNSYCFIARNKGRSEEKGGGIILEGTTRPRGETEDIRWGTGQRRTLRATSRYLSRFNAFRTDTFFDALSIATKERHDAFLLIFRPKTIKLIRSIAFVKFQSLSVIMTSVTVTDC